MTALIEASSPHVMNTYGRLPIAMSHGQGAWVWDVNGRKYLDGLAGIAVNTLGHNHPKLVPALQDQIAKLIHCCNYYHVPGQEALATKLVEFSGMSREEQGAGLSPFREVWNMAKPKSGNGGWLVAGLQALT